MKKFGSFIAEKRGLVLIIAILLLVPSFFGTVYTKINYDIIAYIPKDKDSIKGQDILDKQFKSAAIGILIVDNKNPQQVIALKDKISKVNGVQQVIYVSDFIDTTIPKEILPDDLKKAFYNDKSTVMFIKFVEAATADSTQTAIGKIKDITDKHCYLAGLSAIQKDCMDLVNKEKPLYAIMAGGLIALVLALFMDSFLIPVVFVLAIIFPVMYNMGTNIFFKDISYPTKAMTAALQMGVTMDFSIFLYHRYEKEKHNFDTKEEAMAEAISKMILPIGASCLTAAAGFLSMLVAKITLCGDIGVVMAKGVIFGMIASLTILPALVLVMDGAITKTKHRTLLPSFEKSSHFITKHYKIFVILFVVLLVPAFYGKENATVYKDLISTLPKDMDAVVATNKLKTDYNMTTSHFIVVDKSTPSYKVNAMIDEIEKVKGINNIVGDDKLVGPGIPDDFIPANIKTLYSNDKYKLILANSIYKAASDEENDQIDQVNAIVKKYDSGAMVTGEGVVTKDLVNLVNKDFDKVDIVSIVAILILIGLVFGSLFIPIILVLTVELGVFLNLGIPYYTGKDLPFIAGIVIACIQLGATVNYAILITARFREEIGNGLDKFEAMRITIQHTAKSVIVSGLTFFAATTGVALVTKFDLVYTLCMLVSKGAVIGMVVIIVMLPALLLASEGLIAKTSLFWRKGNTREVNLVEERY